MIRAKTFAAFFEIDTDAIFIIPTVSVNNVMCENPTCDHIHGCSVVFTWLMINYVIAWTDVTPA